MLHQSLYNISLINELHMSSYFWGNRRCNKKYNTSSIFCNFKSSYIAVRRPIALLSINNIIDYSDITILTNVWRFYFQILWLYNGSYLINYSAMSEGGSLTPSPLSVGLCWPLVLKQVQFLKELITGNLFGTELQRDR